LFVRHYDADAARGTAAQQANNDGRGRPACRRGRQNLRLPGKTGAQNASGVEGGMYRRNILWGALSALGMAFTASPAAAASEAEPPG